MRKVSPPPNKEIDSYRTAVVEHALKHGVVDAMHVFKQTRGYVRYHMNPANQLRGLHFVFQIFRQLGWTPKLEIQNA